VELRPRVRQDRQPAGRVRDIAYRRGIGDLLAEGTKRLAEKFGGKEFAINSKGLELAAYEPRGAVGQGLAMPRQPGRVPPQRGYLVLMEAWDCVWILTRAGQGALTILNQNLMEGWPPPAAVCSAVLVLPWLADRRTRHSGRQDRERDPAVLGWSTNLLNKLPGKMAPFQLPIHPWFLRFLHAGIARRDGHEDELGALKDIGERGFNLERMFNLRMGLAGTDDALPKRLTDERQIPEEPRSHVR